MKKDLEVAKSQKSETEQCVTSYEAKATSSESEINRLRREEMKLKESLKKSEEKNTRLEKTLIEFDDQVSKLDDEKLQLKMNVVERTSTIESLKENLAKNEDKLTQISAEKRRFEDRHREEEALREKVQRVSLSQVNHFMQVTFFLYSSSMS